MSDLLEATVLATLAFSAVYSLLTCGRPPAVFWFVVAVVVGVTVQGTTRRARAHVREKIVERIEPASTHSNSSTTVVFVGWESEVVAPFLHGGPRRVSPAFTLTVSDGEGISFERITEEASAALGFPDTELIGAGSLSLPAGAFAHAPSAPDFRELTGDGEATEGRTDNADFLHEDQPSS